MQYICLQFVVLLILLSGVGCGSSRTLPDASILRVLTFNIHHGEGTDGEIDIKRIAKLIQDSGADIVALQEIDRWTERTKKIDIMNELVDLTEMTYAFGKTIDFQGGEYGNGVLTRFPILEERNVLYTMTRPITQEGEQRGAMQLVLDIRGQEIVLMNTHLDHSDDDAERMASATVLLEMAQSNATRPILICGDINDIPDSRTVSIVTEYFSDSWEISGAGEGFTYPASQPVKRIDYIFVSKPVSTTGVSLRPTSARVLKSDASDHLPVLVEFEIINN
ncbi:MAG TPA: endonuclease/exonuclease/phosphatase family protein [Bacteroidota bacterium]